MSTTPLSAARLAEIQARHEAATPGPYAWGESGGMLALGTAGDVFFEGHVLTCARRCSACEARGARCLGPNEPNSAFLAHSWQDVADLLAEVERLRAEIEAKSGSRTVPGAGAAVLGNAEGCSCQTCFDARTAGMSPGQRMLSGFRFACELCGNKRYLHHQDHRLACTGSNDAEVNRLALEALENEVKP
jgi:hypothetical protein